MLFRSWQRDGLTHRASRLPSRAPGGGQTGGVRVCPLLWKPPDGPSVDTQLQGSSASPSPSPGPTREARSITPTVPLPWGDPCELPAGGSDRKAPGPSPRDSAEHRAAPDGCPDLTRPTRLNADPPRHPPPPHAQHLTETRSQLPKDREGPCPVGPPTPAGTGPRAQGNVPRGPDHPRGPDPGTGVTSEVRRGHFPEPGAPGRLSRTSRGRAMAMAAEDPTHAAACAAPGQSPSPHPYLLHGSPCPRRAS